MPSGGAIFRIGISGLSAGSSWRRCRSWSLGEFLKPILNACHSPMRSLTVIGIACLVMSGLLVLAEIYSRPKRTLDHATLKDAMIIGLAQVGALIPGVSRSGSTLTAALFRDLKREEAARFSFLLGLPAIAGAGLKELWELHKAHLDAHGWSILGFGHPHRVAVGLCRDLGPVAHSRAIFRLALRRLPGRDGDCPARLRLLRMAARIEVNRPAPAWLPGAPAHRIPRR